MNGGARATYRMGGLGTSHVVKGIEIDWKITRVNILQLNYFNLGHFIIFISWTNLILHHNFFCTLCH